MLLSDILNEIDSRIITGDPCRDVTSVEFDSRRVSAGSVFVCIKGFTVDGHSFAGRAAEDGAACVIVDSLREGFDEQELISAVKDTGCVIAETTDTKKALALIAAALDGHPEKEMNIYGITGTKGKTTSSFMLRSILEASGTKAGLIGTVCNIIGDEKTAAKHTTPESSEVFGMMRSLKELGEDSLVMEVSSQGLKLDRVYGIRFRVAAFTNLYEDHISPNEHPDMDDYFKCKLKLYDNCETAIVNADCEQAQEVCEGIRAVIRGIYGARPARAVSILYGGSMNAKNAAELKRRFLCRASRKVQCIQRSLRHRDGLVCRMQRRWHEECSRFYKRPRTHAARRK